MKPPEQYQQNDPTSPLPLGAGLDAIMSFCCAMLRDPDGRIIGWSRGAAALFGWTAENAVGQLSHLLLQTEFPEPLERINATLLLAGQWFGEVTRRTRSGDTVRVASHWLMLRDGDTPPRVIEISHDITRFAAAQAAQSYLAAIVESADDAIIGKTLEGTVTSWNRAAEILLGWTAEEMIGQTISTTIPAAVLDDEADMLARIRAGEGVQHVESSRCRRDGTIVPVSLTISPIRDAAGKVFGAATIMRDLGERRRTELAVSKAMIQAAPHGMLLLDAKGQISQVNPETERMFGYPSAELIGQPVEVLLPAPLRAGHHGLRVGFLREPKTRLMGLGRDLHGLRKDGTEVPVEVGLNPIESGGGVGVLATVVDITKRKRAEAALRQANETLEQRVAERTRELAEHAEARRKAEAALAQSQKLEAVGQLTGGVAHDFNNLLTVIAGNLHFMGEIAEGNERLLRLVTSTRRAVERGSRLTSQLLAFSRRQVLLPEIVRIDRVIHDFSGLVRRAVGDSVTVEVKAQPGLWTCEIDPAQFESAVLNLALNARDAMPGGGKLVLSADNFDRLRPGESACERCVCVVVSDTGVGMAPEIAEHAVEPFFTTKPVGQGSGLGLSQVYGFVEQSGGTLRIDSRRGEGTRITMLFPACEGVPPLREARPYDAAAGVPRRATVLVVEDDVDLLELVEETLRAAGLNVITAHDGREALAIIDGHLELQIVVSDVVMPNGVNGVALVQEARRRRPGIGVLLMSGYPRDELTRLGGTGAFPFLPKPFRPGELTAQVALLLANV